MGAEIGMWPFQCLVAPRFHSPSLAHPRSLAACSRARSIAPRSLAGPLAGSLARPLAGSLARPPLARFLARPSLARSVARSPLAPRPVDLVSGSLPRCRGSGGGHGLHTNHGQGGRHVAPLLRWYHREAQYRRGASRSCALLVCFCLPRLLLSLFCCGLSLLGRPLPLLPQRTRCRHLIPALRLCLRALVPWRGCLAVS